MRVQYFVMEERETAFSLLGVKKLCAEQSETDNFLTKIMKYFARPKKKKKFKRKIKQDPKWSI